MACNKERVFSKKIKFSKDECSIPGEIIYSRIIKTENEEKKLVLDQLVEIIRSRYHQGQEDSFRFRLSIDEGIQNAFSHGNNDDPAKIIDITLFEDENEWGIVIKDEGEGFKVDALIDPTSPEGIKRECGRGLLIMHNYMDDVIYFDGGRTLKLIKAKK